MSREWSNDLCGCFNDCSTCIIAFLFPCYTFGKNAEAIGENCVLCCLSYYCFPVHLFTRTTVRGKIRDQKGIEGTCLKDLICITCCYYCSLIQEAQEVQSPGAIPIARE